MANKKTTQKKSVKKKTRSQLKVTKGKGSKATKAKTSASKTGGKNKLTPRKALPKTSTAKPMVSSPPNPLPPLELRSNSHSPKVVNKSKKILEIKDKLELSQVTACLEDLLSGLKSETLCIQHGNEYVTLKPGPVVGVEIAASVKKGKERLVLELTWQSEREDEEVEFHILSSQPVDDLATV